MKNRRIKQTAASLLIVLSLFVASISACACSHHHEISQTGTPLCHQEMPPMQMDDAPNSNAAESFDKLSAAIECHCLQPAPKVSAKIETLKLEKQAAASLNAAPVEIEFTARIVSFPTIQFSPPFYLSDSFYNLSPGRAPPVL